MKDANGFEYHFVKKVQGYFTGISYWVIKYGPFEYDFGYKYDGELVFKGSAYESIDEAVKAIHSRELSLSIGDSVMF